MRLKNAFQSTRWHAPCGSQRERPIHADTQGRNGPTSRARPESRHSHEPRTDEIARALAGAEYPIGKERLLTLTEKNGADGEVMETFNS